MRLDNMKNDISGCVFMVIGNKADLEGEREVSREEGEAFAADIGTSLFFEGKKKMNH